MLPKAKENLLRIINSWTVSFSTSVRVRHPGQIIVRVRMNMKHFPVTFYYETEDMALAQTYQRVSDYVYSQIEWEEVMKMEARAAKP